METEQSPRRRALRVVIVIVAATLATAAIGFGGLAAWSVTTQNNGSTFSAGTVHHTNAATSNLTVVGATNPGTVATTCSDATSPAACGVIFNINTAKPGAVVTGSVKITNTGTLQSTFTLALAAAPVVAPVGNTLCSELTLQVKDAEGVPATVYATGALSAFTTPTALKTTAGVASWNTGDNDTFTFTVTLPAASAVTSMGGTCTAQFLFTQTNT